MENLVGITFLFVENMSTFKMIDLYFRDLHDNSISSLPNEIKKLRLEYFDIRNNKLTTVPTEIEQMYTLKSLYMFSLYFHNYI